MRTELKRFFHEEVKAQEKMQDLRLLRFSATRGGEGICCQRGFKTKSSRHCCIHLWESRKCDLFRSKLLREHGLKWEAVNDSPDSGFVSNGEPAFERPWLLLLLLQLLPLFSYCTADTVNIVFATELPSVQMALD